MSYARVAATASAKAYIEQSEAADRVAERAKQSNHLITRSHAWMAHYRTQPRPTRFNWAPRWPFTPNIIGIDNGKTIEGSYTVMADADAAGKPDTKPGAGEAVAGAGSGAAQGSAREEIGYDTPF